jgi:hypothetical protein
VGNIPKVQIVLSKKYKGVRTYKHHKRWGRYNNLENGLTFDHAPHLDVDGHVGGAEGVGG